MKYFSLFAVILCCNVAGSLAQTPEQIQKLNADVAQLQDDLAAIQAPCGCATGKTALLQDDVDVAQSVIGGFGNRVAIGPHRKVTLAMRQYIADIAAGRADATDRFNTAAIKPNPQRACKIATFAVIGLQMANAFGAQIPPEVIAAAIALQKQVCGTIPPVPTLAPVSSKPAVKDSTSNWVSTQFILDGCAGNNGGCNGDNNTTVLAAAKNMGIPLEADYGPYQGYAGRCHTMSGSGVKLYTLSDWGYADSSTMGVGNTALIKAAIMKYNGVGCAVAADGAFMNYSGGVFSGNSRNINHDVFLAGWDDAKGAWLMVNSWGDWGIDPTTGKSVANPKAVKATGLVLPPVNIRQAQHAVYRAHNMRAITDLAKAAETLPASYSCINTLPGIQNQGQCGSCWDFSGCLVVSGANILAGNLPKSAPMTTGCMWIKYGSNQIGTEAVWGVGGTPVPYVAPPGPGPQPPSPQPGPTRRTSVLFEKATRLYQTNPAKVEEAIKAAEAVLQNAQ